MANYRLNVNGKTHEIDAEPDMPLLWALRDKLGMVGTKYGCGIAQCGACTVHLDDNPVRSCSVRVADVGGRSIRTIEGLAQGSELHPLQLAWIELDVAQCGYCQAGQIMSAAALLERNASPSDEDIDGAMAGNYCRCGTYNRIRSAIHAAVRYRNAAVDDGAASVRTDTLAAARSNTPGIGRPASAPRPVVPAATGSVAPVVTRATGSWS